MSAPLPDDIDLLRAEFRPRTRSRFDCCDGLCGASDCHTCHGDSAEPNDNESMSDLKTNSVIIEILGYIDSSKYFAAKDVKSGTADLDNWMTGLREKAAKLEKLVL